MNSKTPLKRFLDQWKTLEATLLEDSELCKALKIHPVTTRRWRRKGLLPYFRSQRKIYYRMTDVLPFVARRERGNLKI